MAVPPGPEQVKGGKPRDAPIEVRIVVVQLALSQLQLYTPRSMAVPMASEPQEAWFCYSVFEMSCSINSRALMLAFCSRLCLASSPKLSAQLVVEIEPENAQDAVGYKARDEYHLQNHTW